MGSSEKPTVIFVISLCAGVLLLVNGIALGVASSFLAHVIPSTSKTGIVDLLLDLFNTLTGIISTVEGILTTITSILYTLMVIGIILGIGVIVSAVMFYRNPIRKTVWGTMILLLSTISIIMGGGFLLGLIFGVNGGIMALVWHPKH